MSDEHIIGKGQAEPEEKKTKEELFAEDPNRFIDLATVDLCITKPIKEEKDQRRILINTKDVDVLASFMFRIQRHANKVLDAVEAKMVRDTREIKNMMGKGGFRRFIKGGKN